MTRRTRPNLEPLEGRSLLSGLSYSLTTDRSAYRPGQPIVMTFQETNVSDQPVSVQDGPSIDGFMASQNGDVVWRSNPGISPLFIRLDTLQPGQSLTLTATWDGIPTGGTAPVSGQFVISNQLDPQAATATATISGSPSTPSPPGTPAVGVPAPVPSSPGRINGPVPSPGGGDPQPATPAATSSANAAPMTLAVTTNHPTYRIGHPVRMRLTLKDVGKGPASLTQGPYGDGFTVLEGSTPVWHSAGVVSGPGARKLKAGHSLVVRAAWDGRPDHAGVTIAPGVYTIEAVEGGHSGSSTIRIIA